MSLSPEVDLHDFTVAEAKKYLDSFIASTPKNCKEIVVIHGCNRGTALQKFVRTSYSNKRVERKILTLNQGETIFILK